MDTLQTVDINMGEQLTNGSLSKVTNRFNT